MSKSNSYKPGPAVHADVRKDGDHWTLILVRELRHEPTKVWQALTDPAQLHEWAPFDTDRSMGTVGPVTLTTVGTPKPIVSQTEVTLAEEPHLLEYRWGDNAMRWELEATQRGTRLTLWHSIDHRYVAMGAAGWHICFDVLEHLLAGEPLGRIVAGDAMKHDWPRLHTEYAAQFGIEAPAAPRSAS